MQCSSIIKCLKRCHALHQLLVLDQHADCCALAAYARRHIGDTTISNRVQLAAHHDAIVHLVPWYWPVAMMEALVADERRQTLFAFARRCTVFVRLLRQIEREGFFVIQTTFIWPKNSSDSPKKRRYSRLLHYVTAFCRGLAIVDVETDRSERRPPR